MSIRFFLSVSFAPFPCPSLAQARASHTAVLQQRSEVQSMLRQCLDDVRSKREQHLQHLQHHQGTAMGTGPAASRATGGGGGRPRPASARVLSPASTMWGSSLASVGVSGGGGGGGSPAVLSSSLRRPNSAALRNGRCGRELQWQVALIMVLLQPGSSTLLDILHLTVVSSKIFSLTCMITSTHSTPSAPIQPPPVYNCRPSSFSATLS